VISTRYHLKHQKYVASAGYRIDRDQYPRHHALPHGLLPKSIISAETPGPGAKAIANATFYSYREITPVK
jgi:hypothetical protein